MKAYARARWSDNDHYWGPFTFARGDYYRCLAIMLCSGDGEDYHGCSLRVSIGRTTVLLALPQIIKPWRRWVDTSRYEGLQSPNGGYWEHHQREYGFTIAEGALHLHYGPQTHDSSTEKSKCWFYPWRESRQIRHSIYDLEGEHFADFPKWGLGHGYKNGWEVRNAIEAACPAAKFKFDDYDGERIVATCRIEEYEYQRGKGIFRLFFLGRNKTVRLLDLSFSSEVGRRKGSWKGGTVGHSIIMLPSELHEAAFRRYCVQENLTFVGSEKTEKVN